MSDIIKEKQAMCEKCGRNYDLENRGTEGEPNWFYPVHKILKGRGSKKIVVCKNSDKKY